MWTALDQKNYRLRHGQTRFKAGRPRQGVAVMTNAQRQAAWRKRQRIANHERLNLEFLSSLESPAT
jgi:hypothetical protein